VVSLEGQVQPDDVAEVRPFQAFASPTLQMRNPRNIQYCVRESYEAHSR